MSFARFFVFARELPFFLPPPGCAPRTGSQSRPLPVVVVGCRCFSLARVRGHFCTHAHCALLQKLVELSVATFASSLFFFRFRFQSSCVRETLWTRRQLESRLLRVHCSLGQMNSGSGARESGQEISSQLNLFGVIRHQAEGPPVAMVTSDGAIAIKYHFSPLLRLAPKSHLAPLVQRQRYIDDFKLIVHLSLRCERRGAQATVVMVTWLESYKREELFSLAPPLAAP